MTFKKKSEVYVPLYLDPTVAISFLIFKYPVSYMKKFWTLNHSLARNSQDKLETTECEVSLGKTQLVASLTGCQPSMSLSFQLIVCLSKGFFRSTWAPPRSPHLSSIASTSSWFDWKPTGFLVFLDSSGEFQPPDVTSYKGRPCLTTVYFSLQLLQGLHG